MWWGDLARRVAELERWRREHEVDDAHATDKLLRSKGFWLLLVLAVVGSLVGSGLVARVFGWI
jgi:hypothetical protein